MAFYFFLLLCCVYGVSIPHILHAQAGTKQRTIAQTGTLTPIRSLNLRTQPITVPQQFRTAFPDTRSLNIPQGYTAQIFYAGAMLNKARFMTWSPDSVLHVANMNSGTIVALPDRNRDGIADTAIIVANNLSGVHDMKFYRGSLYAALERSIIKLEDTNRDGIYETRSTFIANIAEGAPQPGGGHRTRTMVFDSARRKMYLSIGSLCNVCRSQNPGDRDFSRALIEEWNDDGTGRRTFASGVRNAVGMTLHPRTGRLWATNNGSDWQGNDIPPEWIDMVRDGGFYGYPLAHSQGVFFSSFTINDDYRALLPITARDSAIVRSMAPAPGALVQAHSAPMAIEFANPQFPPELRRGAFVAFRGSWNRTPPTGYKVVYLDFDDATDTTANFVADVVSGFQETDGRAWARPVGLATDMRGNLYVGSDDLTQFIVVLRPTQATSTPPQKSGSGRMTPAPVSADIVPNPVESHSLVHITLSEHTYLSMDICSTIGLRHPFLYDTFFKAGSYTLPIHTTQFPQGAYFCRITSRTAQADHLSVATVPFMILR